MYVLLEKNKVKKYPYSIEKLKKDNCHISFPVNIKDSLLAEYGVFPVSISEIPEYDENTQKIEEDKPIRVRKRNSNGTFASDDPETPENEAWEWVQSWKIVNLSKKEKEEINTDKEQFMKQQRKLAYQNEADPLFFKAHRGEIGMDEWEAKVQEIKDRYPV